MLMSDTRRSRDACEMKSRTGLMALLLYLKNKVRFCKLVLYTDTHSHSINRHTLSIHTHTLLMSYKHTLSLYIQTHTLLIQKHTLTLYTDTHSPDTDTHSHSIYRHTLSLYIQTHTHTHTHSYMKEKLAIRLWGVSWMNGTYLTSIRLWCNIMHFSIDKKKSKELAKNCWRPHAIFQC